MNVRQLGVVNLLCLLAAGAGLAAPRPSSLQPAVSSLQSPSPLLCLSGIYPHLAMFNNEGECGTGAVVPWADRLWVTTYPPHSPKGSSDKLYEITPDLRQIIRPESIGGTHGKAALWAGAIDDVWKLGKPRGRGGPWFQTQVEAGQPSDPFLMTGYDQKKVTLSQSSAEAVNIALEVDLDGTGLWVTYRTFRIMPGKTIRHKFPEAFGAYWVRARTDRPTTATVMFEYQ